MNWECVERPAKDSLPSGLGAYRSQQRYFFVTAGRKDMKSERRRHIYSTTRYRHFAFFFHNAASFQLAAAHLLLLFRIYHPLANCSFASSSFTRCVYGEWRRGIQYQTSLLRCLNQTYDEEIEEKSSSSFGCGSPPTPKVIGNGFPRSITTTAISPHIKRQQFCSRSTPHSNQTHLTRRLCLEHVLGRGGKAQSNNIES
ncbi:hypothetical protein DdX_07145 [Ditylenchus destructor]|uniref:Uncharacterized protein n=1 Tax=Ditylenchus destructor TaxID=166010 RepID=A0AAD4N8S7_9BILA|nr:hypothetical protein DdX_07145 [Ditylenchus destructor]